MILYQNSLMRLDYFPAYSLIEVNWPNLSPYTLPEARLTLIRLANSIRTYEVKSLLVDASRIAVSDLPSDQFSELIKEVMQELKKTKLQRIARIKSDDPDRESRATMVTTASGFPFEYMNFPTREKALNWLQNKPARLPEQSILTR